MAYWWASQGKNYPIAIKQGTLWTCPWSTGRIPTDRRLIQDIQRGDIVFHHEHKMIRAISVAIEAWRDAPRPVGYPKKRVDDRDDGWLVRVQPIDTTVRIPADEFIDAIAHGSPGPLTKKGVVAQQYLSRLTLADGDALLALAGLTELGTDNSSDTAGAMENRGGATDIARTGSARAEQAALRAFLLGSATEAACGLCGRLLPLQFMVAGHIKPRRLCTDDERWDFPATAMAFCLLGCDVLFENGYVTVTEGGMITSGRPCTSAAVQDALRSLVGQRCRGFTTERSPAFAEHARLSQELA